MAAGVPVYDLLGRALLEKAGRKNYYANVALDYTLWFLPSLTFPAWLFVAIVGVRIACKTNANK